MYSNLASALRSAYSAAEIAEIEDQALSKSINDIIIADYLGHTLSKGGRGSDAFDDNGEYEYKCTTTDIQANFNLGSTRGSPTDNVKHLKEKFSNITGAYFARISWGEIQDVYYCPIKDLLKVLERKVRAINSITLNPQVSYDEFVSIKQSSKVNRSPTSTYAEVVASLTMAMRITKEMGIDQGLFGKGGHNHILLAHLEGHQLAESGGGPDAFDSKGKYEYKITITKDWNFHFGARKSSKENRKLISDKCKSIHAAYLATRRYAELTRVIRIPSNDLKKLLLNAEAKTKGGQLNLRIPKKDLKKYVIKPMPDYEWMEDSELQESLSNHGLDLTGSRKNRIDRLISNDSE